MALPCTWLLAMCVGLQATAPDSGWSGRFAIKRQQSSCVYLTSTAVDSPAAADNCFVYMFSELQQATANGVLYAKAGDNQKYQLRTATLTVEGQIDGNDLSFHCPTEAYYGAPTTHCNSTPSMQLAVLHVGVDNKLYAMDVILSPATYPTVVSLAANQPGFGIAQFIFPSGLPLENPGFLQICKQNSTRGGCKSKFSPQQTLQAPMPSGVGSGAVFDMSQALTSISGWIVDNANQLMVFTFGDVRCYFNSAGWYVSEGGTCTASTSKNFTSQLMAHDSRFLDYAGTVTIIAHPAYPDFQSVQVAMWIGISFDALGIQPIVLYVDNATGYCRGMDTFNIVPPTVATSGVSYWYDAVASAVPAVSILEYADRMTKLGDACASQFNAWLYPEARRNCQAGLVLRNGLCQVPSGRRVMLAAPTTVFEMVEYSLRWAVSVAAGLAVAFALSLLVAGLLRAVRRRRSIPHDRS